MEKTEVIQDADFEAAAWRGTQRLKDGPVAARYDQQTDMVIIEISPSGQELHFPAIDVDLYLPALPDGLLGSNAWMAARMGQVGGRATTQAKQVAARENGRLGDRPRKKVTT